MKRICTHPRRLKRQQEAAARLALSSATSPFHQLAELNKFKLGATRQRSRIAKALVALG